MDNVTVAVQALVAGFFHAFFVRNLDIVNLKLFLLLLLNDVFMAAYTIRIDLFFFC